jgi:hypothetical protein
MEIRVPAGSRSWSAKRGEQVHQTREDARLTGQSPWIPMMMMMKESGLTGKN